MHTVTLQGRRIPCRCLFCRGGLQLRASDLGQPKCFAGPKTNENIHNEE